MTPEERFQKIENTLQTISESQGQISAVHAENEVLQKDMLRAQIDLYKVQAGLGKSQTIRTEAIIGFSTKMDRLSDKLDRVLDLAEGFLQGGFGNGRGGK